MGRSRPINVVGGFVSEEMPDPWPEILREAIGASPIQPVIGTYFRKAVIAAASTRDLGFPPAEEPDLRLIELLERYPDVVSVLRRPRQDFLVAPAGRSDLLVKGIQDQPYGIRPDFFAAFSMVSDRRPYYNITADRIDWQNPGEQQPVPDSSVPIEPATNAAEIQLRRDFTEALPENSTFRSPLLSALSKPQPFQAFAKQVREARLQRNWHSFRTERLLEKIQHWARLRGIEWKEAWLIERPDYTRPDYTRPDYRRPDYIKKSEASSSETPIRVEGDPLELLFSGLDAADIQRISIPLDLVLKAISSSKKR